MSPSKRESTFFFTCPETKKLFASLVDRVLSPKQLVGKWIGGEIGEGKGFIIGFCTYFMYRQNLAKLTPSTEAFLTWLSNIQAIEYEIASRKDKIANHATKWQKIESDLL